MAKKPSKAAETDQEQDYIDPESVEAGASEEQDGEEVEARPTKDDIERRNRIDKLHKEILVNALDRQACVIYPYPEGYKDDEVQAAIDELKQAGLVHDVRYPNLTAGGVEEAKRLSK